jgi:5-methyltetrahydrofolate--homocysteine methyltransferase
MTILDRLNKQWIYFDGGTGSLLQAMGLQPGELPETWNLTHPEEIISLHSSYLRAGATVFNTNTFGANRLKYPDTLEEVVTSAVALAREARRRCGREDDAYVALDIGPTGKLLQPMGDLPFEEAVTLFGEVVRIGAAAGADLVLIETMNDSYEAKAALLAAKENCALPVFLTMVFDEKGKMLTGGTPESMVAMLEGMHVDALGINCSLGPRQMLPIVERLVRCSSTPVLVNPNAGLPRSVDGQTVYDVGPDEFAALMGQIAALGVQGVGGCCGTTPAYIEKTIETVGALPLLPIAPKHRSVISSFSRAVEIGPRPVLIGERINPTGKKKFKEALRQRDFDYILGQGLQQEDAGADALDVNVGLPEIDEPEMIAAVVTRLQSVTALPLQIDTSDAAAMERALRLYNGKAMVNSVNGKRESMDMVFPLVAKYGGVVVALALDEGGIPASADGRIAIARRIYDEAARYGIPKEDIVIDGLAMTVSSDPRSALTTLETVRRIRDELGGHSILGVSNISFGLPAREIINSYFFALAMQSGLSCAIINPNNEAMMRAYRAFLALTGRDENFAGFIGAYADYQGAQPPTAAPKAAASAAPDGGSELREAVIRGMAGPAARATEEALRTAGPMDVVNGELIPALDRVGRDFESGAIFLPQLLMAAEAAQSAFEVVKSAMSGQGREMKGKVILATVKGDIHDIGKNIVKVMVENYGYQVIDLGKDVSPETIVEAALADEVRVVGLSALMTTTVGSMAETIRLLRQRKPDTKIVVGGAVMTREYAEQIGADCYAPDAMATVRFCDEVFG